MFANHNELKQCFLHNSVDVMETLSKFISKTGCWLSRKETEKPETGGCSSHCSAANSEKHKQLHVLRRKCSCGETQNNGVSR